MNTGTKVTTGATATTHDTDIHTAIMDVITDVWDRAKQINEAAYEILDLIEADRKRRGEPVNMDLVRKWQAENGVKQDPNSREARMVVIRHDADGKPTVWCDPEIADLVRALNDGGLATVGSCSGHGWRPGNIMLSDGRVLIICKDVDEAKGVVSHFPGINGEAPLDAEAVGGLSAEQLAEILSAYIKPEIIGEALEKLENAPWELSESVKVNAIFETRDGVVTGTTDAKVKRVEWQDDGSLTVVIDYWPQPTGLASA